ncbi:MAG: hypothetical protein DRI98_02520 [Bacteroidetes bacterium]|nr:MAG: hypothetical protein DRI98_02520 [Bacteroidota bacterium]
MKKIIIPIVALASVATGAWAQTDSLWNLDKCMEHAIHYNLDVKRQELMLESTDQDHLQSKLDLLPNLSGSLEHDLGAGRVLDRGTYQWENTNVSQGDLGLQSRLTLFAGLQQLNNMKMNKATYLMNKEELDAMEDNVILSVMTGYLDLLRNQELEDVAEKKVEVTRQQVERMERLVEVGNEPKGKLLEVNAQLSSEKLAFTRAKNAREIAKLNLMHIMNLGNQTHFEIEMPVLPDPSSVEIPELDSVFQYALVNLPQIKSAEYGIVSQERFLAIQQGRRSPTLYANGMLYSNYSTGLTNPLDPDPANPTMDYPLDQQVKDNQYKQVSVGIQIPFFNRWQTQTDINKAKLSLQNAEFLYNSAVLELQQSIQQYHTEALAAMDNYVSAKEAVANSDEAYRFADERFKVGTGTALELQQARNQLYESASEMITSKFVLIFYTNILDFYMGKDIVL